MERPMWVQSAFGQWERMNPRILFRLQLKWTKQFQEQGTVVCLVYCFTFLTANSLVLRHSLMNWHALACPRWSIEQGKKIEQKEVQDLLLKKPQPGADYNKFIKSTLYSPAQMYSMLTRCHFSGLERKPLMATLAPKEEWLAEIYFSSSTFGNVPKGSVLSYQQWLFWL